MAVLSSARLQLAVEEGWEKPRGMTREHDERSVLTARRRKMVHDVGGGRRPMTFITNENVLYLPTSRHEQTLRLRRLERRHMFWKNIWTAMFGVLHLGR